MKNGVAEGVASDPHDTTLHSYSQYTKFINESFASESVREKYFRKQDIKQNLQIYVKKNQTW